MIDRDAIPTTSKGAVDWETLLESRRLQSERLHVLGELLTVLFARCEMCNCVRDPSDLESDLREAILQQALDVVEGS